jgi:hypothetical protein
LRARTIVLLSRLGLQDRNDGLRRQGWWVEKTGMRGWEDRDDGLKRQGWGVEKTGMMCWEDRDDGLRRQGWGVEKTGMRGGWGISQRYTLDLL